MQRNLELVNSVVYTLPASALADPFDLRPGEAVQLIEAAHQAGLIVEGLRRGGRPDLAREIARRFCDLCEVAGGNYENFDALTGQGLRDQGYTWTASVNLLLMHEYLLDPVART